MTTLPEILTRDSDHTRYVNSDYERSRATLLQLLEEGKDALALAMEITRNTEHPRAIEALSGLLKNVADINDKLMKLNKKNKEFYKDFYKRPSYILRKLMSVRSVNQLQRYVKVGMRIIK